MSLTTRPWEHKATGLPEHKHTYIHVLPYGRPIKIFTTLVVAFYSIVVGGELRGRERS